MAQEGVMQFRAEADASCLRELRRSIRAFLESRGVEERVIADVVLAVGEAANSVLMYAYAAGPRPGPLDVDVCLDGERITAIVRDYGSGPGLRSASPGAGLGLPLMAAVARDVRVERPAGGGTLVTLTFSATARRA